MKKILLVMIVLVLTTTVFSCTKQDLENETHAKVDPKNDGTIDDGEDEE